MGQPSYRAPDSERRYSVVDVAFPGIRSFPDDAQNRLIQTIMDYLDGVDSFPPRFQDVLEETIPSSYSQEELGGLSPEEVTKITHYNTARALLKAAEVHMMLAIGVDD